MSDTIGDWLKSSDSREYFELLAFPSIGADPNHLRDCVQCATWLKKWLEGIGAEVKLESAGFAPPVVVAELKGNADRPTVLF